MGMIWRKLWDEKLVVMVVWCWRRRPWIAARSEAVRRWCFIAGREGVDAAVGLHRFKPLIQLQGGTVFAEMGFEGGVMDELRLRKFYPDSELTFDYTFDASGRLTSAARRRGGEVVPPPGGQKPTPGFEMADWMGEADLTPGSRWQDSAAPCVLHAREGQDR